MKNPFESLFKKDPKTEKIEANELPEPILRELESNSIDLKNIKSIEVDMSLQHVDGRRFYIIKLSDGRRIKIDFIGEGYIVEKFTIEDK